jgi:thiaminase
LDFAKFFVTIDERIEVVWGNLLANSKLVQAIEEKKISPLLYAIYMVETYHYTSHNARNQALVGVRDASNPVYTKFCFEHASEEVGHERMALHDLKSLGLNGLEEKLKKPLPETETLIAYLYWISATGNPLQRLGYSYWAESCYQYINPLINKLKDTLSLTPNQLTFFIAHSDIDADHFEDIKTIITRACKTQEDLDSILDVMETSLVLTGRMLDGVFNEYTKIKSGIPSRYDFLEDLFEKVRILEEAHA